MQMTVGQLKGNSVKPNLSNSNLRVNLARYLAYLHFLIGVVLLSIIGPFLDLGGSDVRSYSPESPMNLLNIWLEGDVTSLLFWIPHFLLALALFV
jgi:hypothetical protein